VSLDRPVTVSSSSPGAKAPGILNTTALRRGFEGVHAADDVSISVRPGRITGLIGPNGAGKSTVLAMLAGTLAPESGRIHFEGSDITSMPAYRRARIGLVRTFQMSAEFARLTVLENLLAASQMNRGDSLFGALLGRRYWGADEDRLVAEARALLSRFGMTAKESDYAGDLSGGQKRLVEVMRALMLHPRMLLLDEPMAGVHPNVVHEIADCLESLRDGGLTILLVEHELPIVERLCDPVIVMAQGRVIGEGTLSTLRLQPEILEAYLVG